MASIARVPAPETRLIVIAAESAIDGLPPLASEPDQTPIACLMRAI